MRTRDVLPEPRGFIPHKRGTADDLPADVGNQIYVLTLPTGSYDAVNDDDMMRIMRVDENGQKEFICAVPSGSYRTEEGDDGTRLFRLPDDEPLTMPLGDSPVAMRDGVDDSSIHQGALRRYNARNAAHYGTAPQTHATSRLGLNDAAQRPDAARSMNEKMAALWGGRS